MPSTADARSVQRVSSKIPQAAALAAIGSTVSNMLVWLLGTLLGRMTIGVTEVILFSLIGAVGGAALYALLGKLTRRPLRPFFIISIMVLVVYALGPITAAQAPYMEGAELFTPTTVIATEVMHLVSGGWIIGLFTRHSRAA